MTVHLSDSHSQSASFVISSNVQNVIRDPGLHCRGNSHTAARTRFEFRLGTRGFVLALQYHFASPGGRVLKRLCVQKYCSGISRTRSSMKAFMRRASAASSPLGKFSQTGWQVSSYPAPPGSMRVTHGSTRAPVSRVIRESPVMVAADAAKNGTKIASRAL